MPHCIVEYSKPLESEVELSSLLNSVFKGALNSQLFDAADIKTRALPFNHYISGILRQNFVHVTAKILSGRNVEQRNKLAQSILDQLNELFSSGVSLTVEVYEIERSSYAKVVK